MIILRKHRQIYNISFTTAFCAKGFSKDASKNFIFTRAIGLVSNIKEIEGDKLNFMLSFHKKNSLGCFECSQVWYQYI